MGVWQTSWMGKNPSPRHYIREWREYKDLTQARLSLRCGISEPTLSRIETGEQGYKQGHLEAIAEALGCEPADLIGRLPGAPNELTLLINRVPPDRVEDVKAFLKMAIRAA